MPENCDQPCGAESIVRAHDSIPVRHGGVTLRDLVEMTAEGAVFSEIGAAGNSCSPRRAKSVRNEEVAGSIPAMLHCYYWQVPVIPLRALVLLPC